MAESNITWNGTPITDLHRDALSLQKINENGTVEEMIDTINSNFLEIAKHGGGPAGIDGNNGLDGVDGVNVEYIYAHCDSIKPEDGGTKFPNDTPGKEDLFTRVDINGSATYKGNVTWFDHPNGVSPDHKNEYVFSRFRRNENSQWFYADTPVLWSHWGEKGMDGDGVEYIFMLSHEELDNTSAKSKIFKVSNLNEEQKVIYNIDDFFPGRNWFNTTNGTKAWTALKNAGYTYDQATFMSLFNAPNYFGFPCVDNNWTDDPVGPNIEYNYEYVSIRRSNTDETGKKVWGDYSDPALWSNYSLEGRIFMIYCNTDKDATPVAPQAGQGHWDIANDRLILNGLPAGWTDDNIDKEDGEITWMSSGIFNHSGDNVSWSKPVCISGKDGKDGEDGTNIQFIYALSSMPEYPSVRSEQERLFDAIEQATTNPKYDTYGNTVWYDRAQPISPTDRTEYMWARRRDKESDPWDYDPMPIIWAHWGEDGTDGDGVEYIFTTTDVYIEPENIESHPELSLPKYSALNEEQKKLFQIDDFVPSKYWFDKKKNGIYTNKEKAETALGRTIALSEWLGYFGFGTYPGWTDNPISVTPYEPYQWVSIRRSTADEFDGKRFWEDFSVPVLWNSFGKGTRIFVVYCNVDGDEKPRKPVGGFWYSGNNEDKLVTSSTDPSDYKYAIFDDFTPDYDSFIGYWNDKNIDVENTITWMSSGVFTDDGMNVSWSEPFRLTGASGLNGADGNNQTFVYALSDIEPVWPESESYEKKIEFFENVEGADSEEWTEHPNGYEYEDPVSHKKTVWYDNPQGIENVDGKRTEWVWSKTLPANATATTKWEFAPHPIIWAHWGEDGTDGDGLEYIFFRSTQKNQDGTLPEEMKPVKKVDLVNDVQRTIFNIDDFYPGDGWFVTTPVNNKERARTALEKAGLYDESTFESDWNNKFDIPIVGGGDANSPCWTDNPIGSDLAYPFEWVSIRRSHPNAQGRREWEDFGEPSIWTSYNMKTRIFIVYCCVDEGNPPEPPTGGWWDGTDDGGLITSKEGYELSSPWTDRDTSVSGKISYLSSGLFGENGQNIYWSAPFRMTGAQGRPGADGSNIEFVYALSEEEPQFPKYDGTSTSYDRTMGFFDNVEGAHSDEDTEHEGFVYTENGKSTEWFDNPQGIANEDGKRKEWVWSRSLPANSNVWTFPERPVIWAHWGEDGTDGDGVEYIFSLGTTPTYTLDETTWNRIWSSYTSDTAKAIYAMDDFVPNPVWFESTDNYNAVSTVMTENGKVINHSDWDAIKTATLNNFAGLQNWTDNPRSVTYQYQYQYVSIRKMVDGVWQPFSYPQVWANYSFSQYDAFAFVAVDAGIELGEYQPTGGNFMNPKPSDAAYNGTQLHWTDGPEASSQYQTIWMTKAKVSEKYNMADNSITWSHPQRMADSNVFQVEWSQTDKSVTELISINSALAASIGEEVTDPNNSSIKYYTYNFGEYLRKNGNDEDAAEAAWRYVVNQKLGVLFGDNSSKSVLMATCQVKNNEWTDWVINRVKGEKGEAGTSINVTGHITYERYLDTNTYTHDTAEAKFENDTPTNPKDEELLIVYPKDPNEYGLYYGDDTNSLGGALYMWQYIEGTGWTEFVLNNTNNGNAYTSPNGHLILWDGDSFQDVGNIVGPAGPINKIIIAFADDDPDHPGQKIRVQEGNEPGAKWIGFLTYTEGTEDEQPLDNINDSRWIWSHFKGQDGYGMEYIFKATATKDADHSVPYNINWRNQDGVEPDGWEDEDIEPNATDQRYVWMCWRKYDPTSDKWSDFKGAQGKTGAPGQNGVARLWSVYAESIERVEEYYHADPSSSPSDMFTGGLDGIQIIGNGGDISQATIRHFGDYWRPKSQVIGTNESYSWNKTNKYLFNREVIIYSNGNSDALDPHLISVWADGLIDVVEYYCLDIDGSLAPNMGEKDGKLVPYIDQENNNPGLQPSSAVLAPENEGKEYWTKNPSAMSMDQTYKFLWNISYRKFQDESLNSWSDPYVIGIYGKGENGDSAIYADLDNEMDAISVNEEGRVMFDITCTTILTLYNGSDIVKMRDCDVSGEEKFKNINKSRPSCKVEYTSDISAENPNWVEYNDDVIEAGFDAIRLTLNLKKNDKITNPEYSKITFAPTSIDGDVREVSYVVIGVTNSSIYSVVPTYNSILELEDGNGVKTLDHSSLSAYVLERSGNQSNKIQHDIEGKLTLEVYLNDDTRIYPSSAYNFSIFHADNPDANSSGNQNKIKLRAGDSIKYVLNVKTNSTSGEHTFTMDTETIYVLKQGKDGQPGLPGNGYQYYYGRYVNADRDLYGANTVTIADASASIPVFTINGVSLDMSSEPRGGDNDHQYEYRSERSGFGTSWSLWSTPITVARYLNAEDMEGTIRSIADSAAGSMRSQIMSDLSSTISRASYLSSYIDESGKFSGTFTDGVKSGLVTAVTTSDAFGNAVTSKLNGFITDDSGATAFADWIDSTNGNIATAQTQLSAMSDYATLKETVTVLSGDVASHTEQISNVTSGYAELTQQVANVQYLKDEDGYFIVEENGTRRRAKKSNGSDASIYSEIRSSDVSKLVSVAKELATISETVSNGVAAIDIVAGVGDNSAAAIFEATEDGSSIALKADDVAIKSQYFNLNSSGLSLTGAITATQLTIAGSTLSTASDVSEWINSFVSISGSGGDYSWITRAFSSTNISGGLIQTGNLLAKDSNNKITAGVMGYNTSASNDIRFFAGTTVSASATSSSIISAAKSAPFRVDESGNMYATKGQIAGMSVSASGLQLGDNIFIGNDSEYGDCIKISDYDGNVNILNANGLKIGGSFAAKTAFIVYDLMDPIGSSSTTVTDNLRKSYGIVSSNDITTAFMNYDIIAPISCDSLTIPSYQYFIGRKITIICGHPLLSDINTILNNSGATYTITMGLHESNCRFKFANEGICKFYENGGSSNTLYLQNEAVDIIGLGLGDQFRGFLVSKRYDITTEYEYGQHCKCLGMYNMTGTTINNYMSYNGTGPLSVTSSTSSSTNDTVTIVTPYVVSSSQLPYVVVSVVPSGGLYYYQIQTSLDSTTSTLKIIIKSNTSISSQPYKVMIFNFGDFSSLSLDSKMPGIINKYEYRYGTSGNWYTLSGNCTFNWNDTTKTYLRLTVSPNVKKVDVALDDWSSAQSFYYYNNSGTSLQPGTTASYTASSTTVNIGSVCPKGENNDDTNNMARLSITLHTSSITGDAADVTKVYLLILDQSSVPDPTPTY